MRREGQLISPWLNIPIWLSGKRHPNQNLRAYWVDQHRQMALALCV